MLRLIDRKTWILLALGLALRVGYATHDQRHALGDPAVDGYETIARQIVEHGRYDFRPGVPTAMREPGFPSFIALLYLVFGEKPFIVLLAQALLGLGTCLLLRVLARGIFGAAAGDWAMALAAFYPPFVFYTGYFYRETLLSFLVALWCWLVWRLLREPGALWAACSGWVAGLCAVTVSTMAPPCAAAGLWLSGALWRRPRGPALAATFWAAMSLCPALWAARNFAVFHRVIPGSTIWGPLLYEVLLVPEDLKGTEQESVIKSRDADWRRMMAMADNTSDDGRQQAEALRLCLARIRRDPVRYLQHIPRTALKLWRLYPYPRKYQHDYRLVKTISLLSDGWIVPVGLAGLFLFWRRGGLIAFFAVFLGAATATHALSSAIIRYRLPLMAPVLVLAAGVLGRIWTRGAPQTRKTR